MKLETLIETLHKDLQIPEAPMVNKNGSYSIAFDEGITVTLSEYAPLADNPHDKGLFISAVITACGERGQEKATAQLYTSAMFGNLFGVSTKQGVLGLSANGKNLTLCREIEYNCDYTDFKDILEEFLNTIEIWRETAGIEQKAA